MTYLVLKRLTIKREKDFFDNRHKELCRSSFPCGKADMEKRPTGNRAGTRQLGKTLAVADIFLYDTQ